MAVAMAAVTIDGEPADLTPAISMVCASERERSSGQKTAAALKKNITKRYVDSKATDRGV